MRERRWDYEEPGVLHRTHDMTFGLMGCGRIGQQAARSAAPSFGKVIAYDPYMPPETCPDWIEQVSTIEELFERANVVSLHSPLTAETKHIVNADLLNRMQRGSFIVNASRGALIDPGALLAALDSGSSAARGLMSSKSNRPTRTTRCCTIPAPWCRRTPPTTRSRPTRKAAAAPSKMSSPMPPPAPPITTSSRERNRRCAI